MAIEELREQGLIAAVGQHIGKIPDGNIGDFLFF